MPLAFDMDNMQPKPSLLLQGNWEAAIQHIRYLGDAGYPIVIGLDGARKAAALESPLLQLVVLETQHVIELARSLNIPWIAWMPRDDAELSGAAYAAGALAVLPSTIASGALEQAVSTGRSAPRFPLSRQPGSHSAKRRHFERGAVIPLLPQEVLVVEEGIVAQSVIHEDGSEVLLGLYGPESLLIGHPPDDCFLSFLAHSSLSVTIVPWSVACQSAEFSQHLRVRLRQLEAWAAIQARPSVEDRLLGTLSLLAEQFGVEHAEGTVIDVRITHAQLASAVGAARTTVSRLLGQLRRRERVRLISIASGERFCLPHEAFPSGSSHTTHLHS